MSLTRQIFYSFLSVLFCSLSLAAQKSDAVPVNLLDHLTGGWVLQGTIAGKQTTHDIQATWVLNREYVQLQESPAKKMTRVERRTRQSST